MIDGGFTVPEFVELLVASVLAGLMAGILLTYIHDRCLRRCCLRAQDFEDEAKAHQNVHSSSGDASMIDIRQQTPTIPIQTPPPDECAMFPDHVIPRVEAGYSSTGHQIPHRTLGSQPFTIIPTIDHPSPQAFFIQNTRHPNHNSLTSARINDQEKKGISSYHDRGLRNATSADLSSRTTTTTISTMPHSVRASGSPRYPAF